MRGGLENIRSIFVTGSIEMKTYLVPEIADLLHYFEIRRGTNIVELRPQKNEIMSGYSYLRLDKRYVESLPE